MDMATSVASSAAAAMTSASSGDGGMDMGGGSGDGPTCKISVSLKDHPLSDSLLIPKFRCCGIGTPLTPVSSVVKELSVNVADHPWQASSRASGT